MRSNPIVITNNLFSHDRRSEFEKINENYLKIDKKKVSKATSYLTEEYVGKAERSRPESIAENS